MPNASQWKVALAWFLAAGWAVVIWSLGGDGHSFSQTSRTLAPFFEWLLPGLSAEERWHLVNGIRQSAHVVEYAIFAVLVLRAFSLSWGHSLKLAGLFSLAAVFALALADEARQGQSAVREGSGFDVALDLLGGVLAIGLWIVLVRLRQARVRNASDSPRGA